MALYREKLVGSTSLRLRRPENVRAGSGLILPRGPTEVPELRMPCKSRKYNDIKRSPNKHAVGVSGRSHGRSDKSHLYDYHMKSNDYEERRTILNFLKSNPQDLLMPGCQ